MKRFRFVILTLALALTLAVLLPVCASADDIVTVKVSGDYGQTAARQILEKVNEFRLGNEAYYLLPNGQIYYCYGLQALMYDYDLEKVAMQRAIEIAMNFSHTRPDWTSCWTAFTKSGYSNLEENIASGSASATSAFEQWKEDNEPYDGQGHRRNMLSADVNRIGVGHVVVNGEHYWVQEFGKSSNAIIYTNPVDATKVVDVDVDPGLVTSATADMVTVAVDEAEELPGVALRMQETWPTSSVIQAEIPTLVWTSTNPNRATIEADTAGKKQVIGVSVGDCSLKASLGSKSLEAAVTVVPGDISQARISLPAAEPVYNGQEQKPEAIVTSIREKRLTYGTDYRIIWKDNVNAGTACATFEGIGNYVGTAKKYFKIQRAALENVVLDPVPDQPYTGYGICPVITGVLNGYQLPSIECYMEWTDNVNVGTAHVVLTGGTGNFDGTQSLSFNIIPRPITDCTVRMSPEQLYINGQLVKDYTLLCGDYELVEGVDYTCADTVDPVTMTGTFSFTGAGNFTGVQTAAFTLGTTVTVDGLKYNFEGSSAVLVGAAKANAREITIPAAVTYGGRRYNVTIVDTAACKGMKKLKTLNIGSKVREIRKSAFENCSALKTVTGGTALVTLGDRAFRKCTSLETFTLEKKVKSLGQRVFDGCKKLKKLIIKTTKLTANSVGANAFRKIFSTATVQLPAKKLKAYQEWLPEKGMPKKVRYTK